MLPDSAALSAHTSVEKASGQADEAARHPEVCNPYRCSQSAGIKQAEISGESADKGIRRDGHLALGVPKRQQPQSAYCQSTLVEATLVHGNKNVS